MPERQKDAESSACDSKNILLDDVGNCSYSQVRYRNFSFEQLIGFDYSTFSDRRLTEASAVLDVGPRDFRIPTEMIRRNTKCDNIVSGSRSCTKDIDEQTAHPLRPFEEDQSGIIRSYIWQGYSEEGPTPLPNSPDITSVPKQVLNATTLCVSPRVKKLFFQKWVQDIVIDTFWFIYLEQFCKDRKTTSNINLRAKLFHRIAVVYGDALLSSPTTSPQTTSKRTTEEKFYKVFPDIVAQSVYCALCLAFPVSIANNFATVDFLDGLCELIWLWFCCGPPPSQLWHTWNLVELQGPVKYYDLNSLQIANFNQNKLADRRRQSSLAKHHRLLRPKTTDTVNYDSYPEMARSALASRFLVSQPLAAVIKRQRHILNLTGSSTVMDYYLTFRGIDKSKLHTSHVASGLSFSELQLAHDLMDHSETFLSSLAPSRDAIKEAKDMFANILDLSEAEKKEI